MIKKAIFILFLILSCYSLLYSQTADEPIDFDDYYNEKLTIGADYWYGLKIYNDEANFFVSGFGISTELITMVSISPEAKNFIQNVNSNLIGGYVIILICAGGTGFLLGQATLADTIQDRYVYTLSSFGTILIGTLIGYIFMNNGYDNLFQAIEAYNKYLLVTKYSK